MKKILLAFDDTPEIRAALIQLGAHAADDNAVFNDPDPRYGTEPDQKKHDAWNQIHDVIAVELAGMPGKKIEFPNLDVTLSVDIGYGGVVEFADDRDGLDMMEIRYRQDGKIEKDIQIPDSVWDEIVAAVTNWVDIRRKLGVQKG